MRISRIYVAEDLHIAVEVSLDKTASHYLKNVLRLKSGAAVSLFNGIDGQDYQGIVVDVAARPLSVAIENSTPSAKESSLHSEIIQGLSRSDHVDWMIQKTAELGVNQITLFNAERSQYHLKPAQLNKKLCHWQAIAISACEQCGRAIIPRISFYFTLFEAIEACIIQARLVLAFAGAPLPGLLQSPRQQQIALLLGPEGGLNETEISSAMAAGFVPASLGPRVLRSETAAISALAIAQSSWGDLALLEK